MRLKLDLSLSCFALLALVPWAAAQDALTPLSLEKVTDQVWVAVGETLAPSYDNAGHNNNLSVIIGQEAVVVVNGADNAMLAARLHAAIRLITPLPVTWVINENGQGHAVLGNDYWHRQGARIIAHRDAVTEIERRGASVLAAMQTRNQEKAAGTEVFVPDHQFTDSFNLPIAGLKVQLLHFGEAHSPGDISVWLPDQGVLIAGDIAFSERIPGVFPDTDVTAWLASYEKMAALKPKILIPGHGHPTVEAVVRKTTYDYLQYLWGSSQAVLDAGGGLMAAYEIDQSAYAHYDTFEELAVKNAGRVFQQVEAAYFE